MRMMKNFKLIRAVEPYYKKNTYVIVVTCRIKKILI